MAEGKAQAVFGYEFVIMDSIEEIIEKNGAYVFVPTGTSMLPLIRPDTDTVIVEKNMGRLKKRDVALYKRPDGSYILHRVVQVKKASYTMCGDHHKIYEYGVKEEQILGVMTSLLRDGKEVELDGRKYGRYVGHLLAEQRRSHIKSRAAGVVRYILRKK